jgi:hypothetical protein
MTVLIPDARRSLLGGLIDDAALLRSSPPSVDQAVEAYQRLRATESGWILGRLVVPVSDLEQLAAVLVRNLPPGSSIVPIDAFVDGDTAAAISIAAAVHTMLDPAARIERLMLPHHASDPIEGVAGAVAAGNAVHHGVLPMAALHGGVPQGERMDAIAAAGRKTLRPVGAWIDLRSSNADHVALSSTIRACARSSMPFTVLADQLPGGTQGDFAVADRRYGALNLLAATLSAHAAESDVAALLADDDPQAYSMDFGGLSFRGRQIRVRGSVGADRSPLMSLASVDAPGIVAALGVLGRAP